MDKQHTRHSQTKYQVFDLSQPVPSDRLLAGQTAIRIVHKDQVYLLSLTSNDKLILTK